MRPSSFSSLSSDDGGSVTVGYPSPILSTLTSFSLDGIDPAYLEECAVSGDDIEDVLLLKRTQQWQWPRSRRLRDVPRLFTRFFFRRRRVARRHSLLFLLAKYTLYIVLAVLILTPVLAPSYLRPPKHYGELAARCKPHANGTVVSGCANPHAEQVFISISLYDQNGHLAAGRWGRAILELIHLIGPENVFLSIYENDSGQAGAAALARMRDHLPCRSEIVYDEHVPMDIFPTVTLPDGSKRVKRVAYLAEMRNRALRPLDTLSGVNNTRFDKVLFLNDVAFRPIDAAQLLFSTNRGDDGRANYLSTCALDWKLPFIFYDTFAQRDAEGYSNGLPIYPVFTAAGSGLSRADMAAQTDAVRVQACWGGMVAMQAEYLQNSKNTLPYPAFQDVGSHVVDPVAPTPIAAPVRFRHEPEVFVESCECCLLLADVSQAARVAGVPASQTGVFVNPYVRVAYKWNVLRFLPLFQRWEKLLTIPHAIISHRVELPKFNPHRTVKEGDIFTEEVWDVAANKWTFETRPGRNGMACRVREMQLIREEPRKGDRNWINYPVPPGERMALVPHS